MKALQAREHLTRLAKLAPSTSECLPELAPGVAKRHFRLFAAIAGAFLCLSYLLMVNRYWHFSPDSGRYLTLAQNLDAGKGYVFSGATHTKYPAGTASFLSLALRASREFLWLNAVICGVMLASLALLYFVLRRLATPVTSVLIVLLTGTLFWVHEYASTVKSEAPFFFLSNLTVLLLLAFTTCRRKRARALLLIAVCGVWALSFWFRVLACFWLGPFVVTILLADRSTRSLRYRIASAALVSAIIVAAMLIYLRWEASGPPSPFGIVAYKLRLPPVRAAAYARALAQWPPRLLFPPWDMLARLRLPGLLADGVNGLVFLVVLVGAWRALRCGQIIAASSLLFLVPLVISGRGDKATLGRYAMAVAPFTVLLFLTGLDSIGRFLERRTNAAIPRQLPVFVGILAILLPNVLLLFGNICVQRSRDFYAVYRGGAYSQLMGIVRWLDQRGVAEPVGVQGVHCVAAVPCLTESRVIPIPDDLTPDSPNYAQSLADFARRENLRYLLTYDRTQPWPIWHLPAHYISGGAMPGPYHQLWEYSPGEGRLTPLSVEPARTWPTRVPARREKAEQDRSDTPVMDKPLTHQ